MEQQIESTRKFKAGYFVHKGRWRYDDDQPWIPENRATNLNGDYIGSSRDAYRLCQKRGIKPELAGSNDDVCSIGFSERDQKWWGWSHRALWGFGIGDVVEEGDCCATPGVTDDYLAEHPETDISLPVGFEAKTPEDAKRMAMAFAESVS